MNFAVLNGEKTLVTGQVSRVQRKRETDRDGKTFTSTEVSVEFRGAPGRIDVSTDYYDETGKNQSALSAELGECKVGEWVTFLVSARRGISKGSGKPYCMYDVVQMFDAHESGAIDRALSPVGDVVAPPLKKAA